MMRRALLAASLVLPLRSHGRSATESPSGRRFSTSATSSCFVVLPGWFAYLALADRAGGALRQLAIGWALGYVLEILAFMVTAATGTRPLFFAYPVVICAIAALVSAAAGSPTLAAEPEPGIPPRFEWAIAAVCLLGVGYIALAYFPGAPLPGTKSVDYFIDYPRWIAMAADAKHHWPIMDPSVSGEPLPYHYFVNIHLAAASQVTGLGLPLIYFRLFILPLTVVRCCSWWSRAGAWCGAPPRD